MYCRLTSDWNLISPVVLHLIRQQSDAALLQPETLHPLIVWISGISQADAIIRLQMDSASLQNMKAKVIAP